MSQPQGISRANFLHHLEPTDGVMHSVMLKGGYQEMVSISKRNQIPAFANSNAPYTGFTLSDDPLSTGKRRVGMLVSVLEENKFYQLIPVGFFGNGGNLGETEWLALPEWERALRMDPTGTYCSAGATPANGFTAVQNTAADIGIAADANSCWVEISLAGADGTSGIDGLQGEPGIGGTSGIDGADGTSGIDGLQGEPGANGTSGTSGISLADNTKIFNFLAPTSTHYSVGQDTDYVGGSAANTNPILYVTKGETYVIRRGDAGHPLEISKDGNLLTAGIQSGSFPITEGNDLVWKVPQDASGIYTYKCTVHGEMTGQIIICCGDGVIAPDEPTPTPTAVPNPTATAVPNPTATPADAGVQFYLDATDGNGNSNSGTCGPTDVPVWTSSFANINSILANNTESLFSDSAMTVPFSGGARWYTISDIAGGATYQILVREGVINNIADCPLEQVPTATPIPEPTATPVPEPTATEAPRPTATPEVPSSYTYRMDPCDGVSPYVIAESNNPLAIGEVYSLTGIEYQDRFYTVLGAIVELSETTIGQQVIDCAGGPIEGGDNPMP